MEQGSFLIIAKEYLITDVSITDVAFLNNSKLQLELTYRCISVQIFFLRIFIRVDSESFSNLWKFSSITIIINNKQYSSIETKFILFSYNSTKFAHKYFIREDNENFLYPPQLTFTFLNIATLI